MRVIIHWFIRFLCITTITFQRLNEGAFLPEFIISNTILKCLPKNEGSIIPVGDSAGFYFEESYPSLSYSVNTSRFHCFWTFKPLHYGNYVELYFHNIQPSNCYISNVDVYVSGVFSEKICSEKKVEGQKFFGKKISLRYNFLKASSITHLLKITAREASPVNPGCDFKTREIGYRYQMVYELNGEGYPITEYGKKPVHGTILSHVPFTLSFVNKENLGVTLCFDDTVLLPVEDVPSCHSAVESNCEWEIGDGIPLVYEINDLKGYHWKVIKNGTFKTKSTVLELEAVCLYVEYLLGNSDNNGKIKVFAGLPNGQVLLTEYLLLSQMWETARITTFLPDHLRDIQIQLILEITIDGIMYVNKIFGCNPFTMEDRYLISTGNNILLFGSIEKEFFQSSKVCKNGGQHFGNRCLCAIGFRGDNCEYGCGENKFGFDCGSYCSLLSHGCKQIIFCDDILGCSCASGFAGEYCHIACAEYDYGANCHQKCGLCLDNASCNRFTGYCDFGCENGYMPPFCLESFIHFIIPPNVTNVSFQEITIMADINSGSVIGAGVPTSFIVQCKEHGTGIWNSSAVEAVSVDGHLVTITRNLKADVSYDLRFILLTETGGSFYDNVPSITVKTSCRAYIKYKINLDKSWISGAKISWQKLTNDSADCAINESNVLISSGTNWKKFRVSKMELEFFNLISGTTYRVKIKPVLHENSPYSYFSFTTPPKCSGDIHNVDILNVGPHNADVKWDREIDKYTTFVITYSCARILADPKRNCSTDQAKFITAENKYSLTKLHPNREYKLTINEEMCEESEHRTSQFITKVDVPNIAPEKGIISSLLSTNAKFIWSLPDDCSECNGFISGYHIQVMDTKFKKLFVGQVKDPVVTLEGLLPEKNYILHVFLINESGWNNATFLEINFTTQKYK